MNFLMIMQTAADTLATQIGSDVGTVATGLVLSVLALANKFLTDVAKKVIGLVGTLPDIAKPIVAILFAQVVVFVNAKFGVVISPDLTALGTSLTGIAVGLASSGWHSILKLLKKSA